MRNTLAVVLVILVLIAALPAAGQESITLRNDNGLIFTVGRVDLYTSVASRRPNEAQFAVILATIENRSDAGQCATASDVRLILDDFTYAPQADLMSDVKETLVPTRDYLGPILGQCVDAGETEPTFVAFDVSEPTESVVLTFGGQEADLSPLWRGFAVPDVEAPETDAETGRDFRVSAAQSINARAAASTSGAVVTTLQPGTLVLVTGEVNGAAVNGNALWYEVALEDETAFVHSSLLEAVEEPERLVAEATLVDGVGLPGQRLGERDDEASRELVLGLMETLLPSRRVRSVEIADGRANGGERALIVAYESTETSQLGIATEIVELYSAMAVISNELELTFDSASLVVGNVNGDAIGIVVAPMSALDALYAGDISELEFFEQLEITAF